MTELDGKIAAKDIIDPDRVVKTVQGSPFEVVHLFLEVCDARKAPDRGVIDDLKGSAEAWIQAI
jgi:hypothetical protein